ncbi:TNF receptor-associated factor 3 [Exaiptasia diaphana]|uniref:Uncharacterized protein n=1 Tax=Exaiptasia diaphana TaxID=2652724 RepID=A0A913YGI8_EXADI|nr:TNF receptor-associated factor 3 [Exaiptasia diaphana]
MLLPIVLPCGHSFCHGCMEKLANGPANNRKCAICRSALPQERTVNRELISIASKLLARCMLCPWQGTVGGIQHHKGACQWKTIECPFVGCIVKTKRRDMPDHKRACLFRLEDCIQCKLSVPIQQRSKHDRLECTNRDVLCPYFSDSTDAHTCKKKDFLVHIRTCRQRVGPCSIPGCHFYGPWNELEQYKASHEGSHPLQRRTWYFKGKGGRRVLLHLELFRLQEGTRYVNNKQSPFNQWGVLLDHEQHPKVDMEACPISLEKQHGCAASFLPSSN